MISIGIGISTTPNRQLLKANLKEWKKFKPPNSEIVIKNDVYFRGVATTKNILLSKLDHCDHIFLIDDDVRPLSPDWWKPYVESEEPHLMYQFKLPNSPPGDMRVLYQDDKIKAYSHTRGAFIYIKKIVLDKVGGMDTTYGQGYYEHTDWTNRIHNAGLTTYRAMDVVGSEKLLYCSDQDGSVTSSIDPVVKDIERQSYFSKYNKSKLSKEFKVYK